MAAAALSFSQTPPAKEPVKVFTWAGRGTGMITDHNQDKLAGPKGTADTDYYPTVSSVGKIGKADIVYIRNHGGVIETNPYLPGVQGGFKKTRFENLKLPTAEEKGPELVLAWGCQNGRPADIEQYAKGFGVLKDAKTKVYVGPTFDVPATESVFPAFFFEEFAKGDVSVRDAARIAYTKWAAKWGELAQRNQDFDKDIGIWGNGDLTLNQIRANLTTRRGGVPPAPTGPNKSESVSPPNSKTGPGFPAGALVEREYWDAEKRVLKREYAYILAGGRKIRHGVERRYFQTGTLEYEAVRKLDVLEGLMIRYWGNGRKFDEAAYKDNVLEGPYQAFHENEASRAKGQFKRGRKVGEWTTWHFTGKKESMGSYLSDFYLVESVPWDLKNIADVDKGLYQQLGTKTGHWWHYYPSGNKQLEEIWGANGEIRNKDDELFGPRLTWYDNAANSPESEDIPGGQGYRSKYYDNGQIAEKCPRDGKCRYWDRDGTERK